MSFKGNDYLRHNRGPHQPCYIYVNDFAQRGSSAFQNIAILPMEYQLTPENIEQSELSLETNLKLATCVYNDANNDAMGTVADLIESCDISEEDKDKFNYNPDRASEASVRNDWVPLVSFE